LDELQERSPGNTNGIPDPVKIITSIRILLVSFLGISIALNLLFGMIVLFPDQPGTTLVTSPTGPERSDKVQVFSGNVISQDNARLQAPAVMSKISYSRQGSVVSKHTTTNGTMMDISVEIVPGEGRVLVETKPLMGVVFQKAANTAVQVAASHAKANLSGNDVIVSIYSPGEIPEVDGPSAGALMTAVTIAAIGHHELDQNVTLTGTIDSAGHVGAIGGVLEKAQAAKQYGKTLILVPQENSNLVISAPQQQTRLGQVLSPRSPETVDAKQYIEKNTGIRVEYVRTISDITGQLFI